MTTRHLESSRTFPVTVEHAHDVVLVAPLSDIFRRRFLAIPPIAEVIGQQGVWGTAVGQTRTIRLTDGGTMLETITELDPPSCFRYSIGTIKGLMKPLVASVDGTWAFATAGTGVRITWTWEVTPTRRLGRLAMPLFARMWQGYATRAMDQIEQILRP